MNNIIFKFEIWAMHKYIFILISIILLISMAFFTQCTQKQKILHQENFNRPELPQNMFIEGSKKVSIWQGHLLVDANAETESESNASTIWLNKEFSGDLKVEFDVSILNSKGDKNNINFFFLYSDTTDNSLLESSYSRREGSYKSYHSLNGYIFTYLANGNPDTARFRFRDCPGFNLLKEKNAYHCFKDTVYHIEITKKANRITYSVDGNILLDSIVKSTNPIHNKGIMGFRTWRTELWWDNLKITSL